jgi:hypothetical protein|tara:strand:+ start:249 stop:620 length:372 start_codon:yes stop_codon:yes gene_type:complete
LFVVIINALVADDDQDGVPDEFDLCSGSDTYEVDQFGCTCDQKNCPSGSFDDYCDGIGDGICDIDCLTTKDTDCSITIPEEIEGKDNSLAIIIALTFLLIIIILGYLEFRRLKYQKELNEKYK